MMPNNGNKIKRLIFCKLCKKQIKLGEINKHGKKVCI